MIGVTTACLCGRSSFEQVFQYNSPPPGEVRFRFSETDRYLRRVLRCTECGHFISVHSMNAAALYSGDYVTSTYGEPGIGAAFERIIRLDPRRSDNVGRVERVLAFARMHFGGDSPRTILDVGSGL